jgi:transposase InsO family protein
MKSKSKIKFSANEKLKALNVLNSASIEFVARRYHCSTRSLYRWRQLYDGTLQSLENRSSRPLSPHPNAQKPDEIRNIQNLIRRNPHIGLNELYGKLTHDYSYTRNPVTLYRFLRKIGYYVNVKKRVPYKSKPYETPTKLGIKWQMDVKVVPRDCYSGIYSDSKFYQYTVMDEASRERFVYPYQEQCQHSSVDFLRRAIAYFGYKPETVQTDNGQEFTYIFEVKNKLKVHLFDLECRKLGIQHKRIRPRTPRHNGKVERSHRSDNERFYKFLKFYSFSDLLVQMKAYLKRSNLIPMSVLNSCDGKRKWLSPIEKRQELLLFNIGIV